MKFYGLAMIAVGLVLRIWAIRTLTQAGLLKNDIMGISQPTAYTQAGPYRWTPHPAYLGSLLLIAGVGVFVQGLYGWILALPAWPFYASRIHEENQLRGKGWL